MTWALGVCVFLYACLRAHSLSMTHDEAVSFLHHIFRGRSYWEILRYSLPTVNNHLLNTLLMKFFCGIAGYSEFVVRIPALIGCLIYLTGINRLLSLFLKGRYLLLGFGLCILNPFLIDYFSCARGYSLGLGFLAWGMYFLARRVEGLGEAGRRILLFTALSCLFFAFSVLANLTFLHVYFAGVCFFAFVEAIQCSGRVEDAVDMLRRVLKSLARILSSISPSALLLAVVYAGPMLKLMKIKDFYYGGNTGFFSDTVTSLIVASFYSRSYDGSRFESAVVSGVKIITIAVVVLSVALLLRRCFVKSIFRRCDKFLGAFCGFLLITAFLIAFQHWTVHSLYVIDRGAIFFIPIFFVLFLALWNHCRESLPGRCVLMAEAFFLSCTGLLIVHGLLCVNLSHYRMMIPDADTKAMMCDIEKLNRGKKLAERSLKMGVQWISEPSVNYYIIRNKMDWMQFVDRNGPDGEFDFYYLFWEDKHHQYDDRYLLAKRNLRVLKRYDRYNTFLACPLEP